MTNNEGVLRKMFASAELMEASNRQKFNGVRMSGLDKRIRVNQVRNKLLSI